MSFFKPFPYVQYEFFNDGVKTRIKDIFRYIKVQDEAIDDANGYKFYQIHDGERPDALSYKLYGTPEYYWTFFLINDTLNEGLSGWPLSSQEFEKYMNREYEGIVINTKPVIATDIFGQIEIRDSIAGKFQIGELVQGTTTNHRGTLAAKDSRSSQLILENIEKNTGTELDPIWVKADLNLQTFAPPENLTGLLTGDVVSSHQVFDRRIAPKYYIDSNGLIVDNDTFFPSNVSSGGSVEGGVPDDETIIVTHREYEDELNNKRSAIRVIRPENIQDFVLRFKRILNESV
jgi:hypothetical protein|tara:strand:+ start:9518 stop:10384 length:867 start_codon:yes stop_codon:yes gene_type:complete